MTDFVPIPWGNDFLQATRAEFDAMLARGLVAGPVGAPTAPPLAGEALVDSKEMGKRLGVPAEWVEGKAKEGAIPSLMVGRYRRFNPTEVLGILRSNGHAD